MPAVKLWALLGTVILAVQLVVVVRWVTGPFFERVPTGPSDVPGWMSVAHIVLQAIAIPIALVVIYRLYWVPWRRDGRVGIDGLLAVAFISLSFQDPLSAYIQPWFTYSSDMVNFGAWQASIPGHSAFAAPGAMVNEPILFISAVYVIALPIATAFGCWVMRAIAAWRPQTSAAALIAGCFAAMCVFDLVFEGLVMLPLGVWEYPGGHWAVLFPDSYHKFPAQEMLTFAAIFTIIAPVRYFRDDHGYTIVERGVDKLKVPEGRKRTLRLLAVVGLVNVAMFVAYTVPNSLLSVSQPSWPKDLQSRSYLTNGVCGDGTGRVCPGPTTPIVRDGGAALGPGGSLTVPSGAQVQDIVPFKAG